MTDSNGPTPHALCQCHSQHSLYHSAGLCGALCWSVWFQLPEAAVSRPLQGTCGLLLLLFTAGYLKQNLCLQGYSAPEMSLIYDERYLFSQVTLSKAWEFFPSVNLIYLLFLFRIVRCRKITRYKT